MKRIVFPAVLLATILTGGLLAYAIWKATPTTSQQFFDSGKKYYEQKMYAEAVVQFLNSIQKDAKNRDARYLLALSYSEQNNLNSAVRALSALLEVFPDDVEASLRLGNIYFVGGFRDSKLFREAAEIAQKVLSKEPQNVPALILLGNATAGLQDYHSSEELFGKAVTLDPQNTTAFLNLGTSQALQRNYKEAEQAFLKAREIDPKNKSALMALGNYYQAVGSSEKAESMWKEALALYPADRDVYFQAVQFYYRAGRIGDIEKILREARAKNTKDPEPSFLLAEVYVENNRLSEARTLLLELRNQFPDNVDVAAKLAANYMEDQRDKAQGEIDRIIKADSKNPVGYVLLGELQFRAGKYEDAEATLGKALAITSSYPQPHFFLGTIAAKNGQLDQAQDHYQKSLALNAGYLPSRVALGEVFLNKGRLGDAKEELRQVLNARPGFAAARLLKSEIDAAERNYVESERELTALLKEQPDNALVQRQAGLYYESRGQTANAEKSLVRAIELQPDSQEILTDLTLFYIRNKETERAIQRIKVVPDEKKLSFHYELMGLAYSQGGRLQDAERAYKMALEKDRNRSSSDVYLVGDYIKSGRMDDALQKLDQMTKKNPFYASAYGMKGFIYQVQGKLEEAKKNYVEALKIDPTNVDAANNYAVILAEQGQDLETALRWAQMARKTKPESPDNADTLGWVHYKLARYALARDQLQFAVSKQPDNPAFQYHLAMVYKETKQIVEAQNALRKAISSPGDYKEKGLAQTALKEMATIK